MDRKHLVLRRAVVSDARSISNLLSASFSEYRDFFTSTAYESIVLDPCNVIKAIHRSSVWVADSGGAIVGTVSLLSEVGSVKLRSMAVHPGARGFGLGRMLLTHSEALARKQAVASLSLYTVSFLKCAIRLYEHAGFTFTGEADIPHGIELLEMAKTIKFAER